MAYLIPFVADLMIVTASLAILDAIRHHAPKPPLAMASLVAGIGSTLAMNIVAGLRISAGGALVAALRPNDAEEDVTERVSLTRQQPTAGHPLSYVAVGFPACFCPRLAELTAVD